jgi:hypothetical protein
MINKRSVLGWGLFYIFMVCLLIFCLLQRCNAQEYYVKDSSYSAIFSHFTPPRHDIPDPDTCWNYYWRKVNLDTVPWKPYYHHKKVKHERGLIITGSYPNVTYSVDSDGTIQSGKGDTIINGHYSIKHHANITVDSNGRITIISHGNGDPGVPAISDSNGFIVHPGDINSSGTLSFSRDSHRQVIKNDPHKWTGVIVLDTWWKMFFFWVGVTTCSWIIFFVSIAIYVSIKYPNERS